jgi:type III pantothenate kinase
VQPELLLFDIGNTSTKIGLGNAQGVLTSYTLPTETKQTADSLGLSLTGLLAHAGVAAHAIVGCAVSSVSPAFESLLREAVERYVGCPFYRVGQELPVPLQNCYERPEEVGEDRLMGAYAASVLYPHIPSFLLVDFGTAVTIDCVSEHAYMGGLIFPGPRTALAALSREAARLPKIDLDVEALAPVPGRSTVVSMKHGLVFGFASMVEGLTARLGQQMLPPVMVLGTGGFAPAIARVSPVFDHVLPTLLLEGLRHLYYSSRIESV